MEPRDFILAIIGLAALVTFAPVWVGYVGDASLTGQSTWLAGLLLPALVALFITSWVRPSMTTPVLVVFMMAAVLAIAPQLWTLSELGATASPDDGLASALFALAAPLLFVTFALGLGWRHLRRA